MNTGDEWIVVQHFADDKCIYTENEADLLKTLIIMHD